MNFLMTLFIGLATLTWGVFANVPLTRDIHWANTSTITTTTTTTTTLITASKTASAEPSIYTIPCNYTVPGNGSVEPIQWHLSSLQAFADRHQQIAQ